MVVHDLLFVGRWVAVASTAVCGICGLRSSLGVVGFVVLRLRRRIVVVMFRSMLFDVLLVWLRVMRGHWMFGLVAFMALMVAFVSIRCLVLMLEARHIFATTRSPSVAPVAGCRWHDSDRSDLRHPRCLTMVMLVTLESVGCHEL